jgi:uncharacterized protein (TIGR02246 family)
VKSSSNLELDSDISKIAAVRESWNLGLQDSDVNCIAGLMTDDVVLVHRDGRCVCGKEELKANLSHFFGMSDTERRLSSSDLIIHEKWAFQINEVESTTTAVRGGAPVHVQARSVVVFARQPDGSWKIARMIELLS